MQWGQRFNILPFFYSVDNGYDQQGDSEEDDGFDQQCDNEQVNGESNEEVDDRCDRKGDDDGKQSKDNMLLEVTYHEEQAIEQLSAVFKLLKMDFIHDKWVPNVV